MIVEEKKEGKEDGGDGDGEERPSDLPALNQRPLVQAHQSLGTADGPSLAPEVDIRPIQWYGRRRVIQAPRMRRKLTLGQRPDPRQ